MGSDVQIAVGILVAFVVAMVIEILITCFRTAKYIRREIHARVTSFSFQFRFENWRQKSRSGITHLFIGFCF
jgi:hypothetical protein